MRNLELWGSGVDHEERLHCSLDPLSSHKVNSTSTCYGSIGNKSQESSINFAAWEFCGKRNEDVLSDILPAMQRMRHRQGKIDLLTASYRRWGYRQEAVNWLAEMGKTKNWVILDTETTGSRTHSEVIDVSVISAQGKVLFSSLLNPTTEIEPIATSIHGLTRSHVKHAPRYPDIHQQLCEVLGNSTIIGYNVCFDIRLLVQTAQCYHLTFPFFNVACLMYCYAKIRQRQLETKRPSVCRLDIACQEMGIPLPLKHRAEPDAYAVYALFKQLMKTYTGGWGV